MGEGGEEGGPEERPENDPRPKQSTDIKFAWDRFE